MCAGPYSQSLLLDRTKKDTIPEGCSTIGLTPRICIGFVCLQARGRGLTRHIWVNATYFLDTTDNTHHSKKRCF